MAGAGTSGDLTRFTEDNIQSPDPATMNIESPDPARLEIASPILTPGPPSENFLPRRLDPYAEDYYERLEERTRVWRDMALRQMQRVEDMVEPRDESTNDSSVLPASPTSPRDP
jgi:hypothetical protein